MFKNRKGKNMCIKAADKIMKNYKDYNKDINSVKRAADEIRADSGNRIPVPVVEIVKSLGFRLFAQELPRNIGGFIIVKDELKDTYKTDKIISVNIHENPKRRRFTVAHELGHYLLDFAENKSEFYNAFEDDETAKDDKEKIINAFAAMLLIPEDEFKEKYEDYKKDKSTYETIKQLSEYFLVPVKAIETRIKEIYSC
ncbi:MAG: ImmA/IrrE family metallo-endopeptidase [Candidatus Gastranaerophilaceae bacterium]